MATAISQVNFEWYEHVVNIRPATCPLDPSGSKIVAAILKHTKVASLSNIQDDFLWVNCKPKTTLAQLHQVYASKNAGIPFEFRFQGTTVLNNNRISDLLDLEKFGAFVLETIVLNSNDNINNKPSLSIPSGIHSSQVMGSGASRIPLDELPMNYQSSLHPNVGKAGNDSSKQLESRSDSPDSTTFKSNNDLWLNLQRDAVSYTGLDLPSQRVPDQCTNQAFLLYLDDYFTRHEVVRELPISDLVDFVWQKWSALSDESGQRSHFYKKLKGLYSGTHAMDMYITAIADLKPDMPVEKGNSQADNSQEDKSKPMLDFKKEFDAIEENDSKTATEASKPKFQIQELLSGASLEELEDYVQKGSKWLQAVRTPLASHGGESRDADAWVQQIDRIQGFAARTRTIIGVVGNTGAGKSSIINALLDEEQLLPTNTMRACTAVVTELAYNHEPGRAYRGEIEFIDETSWHSELKILFSDLIDDSGNISRDCTNPETDAGVAYAKVRAVYPQKTKEDIANSTISNLIKEVSHVLGKTQKVESDDCKVFYKRLQTYIDSQEKITAQSASEERKGPKPMEFWPLIKAVRIYCKSAALESGAVIVDLPGVHDANAARAAVAEGYMKRCSGLWIVAPIIRAVDDKAAKNLLGQTFKRQIKMDGGFGQISFICSKTDDISLMEATASLGLEAINGPLWEEADKQSKLSKELAGNIKDYSATREALSATLESIDAKIERWEELKEKLEDDADATVYAPIERKRKAKSMVCSGKSNNKARRLRTNEDDFIVDGSESEAQEQSEHEEEDDENDDDEVAIRKPLTEDEISEQLAKFKTQKKEIRKERASCNAEIKAIQARIQQAKQAEKDAEAKIAENCIKGRNDYSKQAIKQDFAAGVRELDQETAEEDDPDMFNPEEDIRDYDEVAQSLPVFCVSSRGYQQLSGRLKKDGKVPGFTELAQTEVPALQHHCKQLTEVGRTAACRNFLNGINQLANSLSIWALQDGTNNHLTPEQREKEDRVLTKSLDVLESSLQTVVEKLAGEFNQELNDVLLSTFGPATQAAGDRALATSDRWGSRPAPANPSLGGHPWATYKAVCRRSGVFVNARGPINFNEDLVEPMLVKLLPNWEKYFSRRVPAMLAQLPKTLHTLLHHFHNDVAVRWQKSGLGIATLPALEQQLETYKHRYAELATGTRRQIDDRQKDLNRQFVPFVTNAMVPAYTACVEERGPGSFARMKQAMRGHVIGQQRVMFHESTTVVKTELKNAIREAAGSLQDTAQDTWEEISRDYRTAFSGTSLKPGQTLPKWHRKMRVEVSKLLPVLEDYLTGNIDDRDVGSAGDDGDSDCDLEFEDAREVNDASNAHGSDEDTLAAQLQFEHSSQYVAVKNEEREDEMRP